MGLVAAEEDVARRIIGCRGGVGAGYRDIGVEVHIRLIGDEIVVDKHIGGVDVDADLVTEG